MRKLFSCVLLLCVAGLSAVEPEMSLRLATPIAVRLGHPNRLDMVLTQTQPVLREGRLRLTVLDGNATLMTWTSDLWAISGERRSTVLLPPIPGDDATAVSINAAWMNEDGTMVDAGSLILLPPCRRVLGLCVDQSPFHSLAPERLVSGDGRDRTATMPIPSDGAPITALGWAVYDVVAIDDANFSRLVPAARAALIAWVRGGGGLAIFGPTPPDLSTLASNPGLGRVLEVSTASDEHRWRQHVARLWGFKREQQRQFVAGDGQWMPDQDRRAFNARQQQRGELQAAITRALWPQSMAQVPVGPVLGIFAVFVLMVGPGEWFLLGLIRRRRWTWITFPLTAAAATWATLAVAQHYLGNADHHRSLIITDRDAQGVALRTTTWDLHILGSGRVLSLTPGDASWLASPSRAPDSFQRNRGASGADTVVAWTVANGRASVERSVNQWSPALSVTSAWGGNAAAPTTSADVIVRCDDGELDAPRHLDDWLQSLLSPPTTLRASWTGTIHYQVAHHDEGITLYRTWHFSTEDQP